MVSRNKAIKRGLKQFDGSLCSKHPKLLGRRQTSNGICIGCRKERHDAWKAAHPSYMPERLKKWAKQNREKINARKRTDAYRAKRRKPEYRKRVQCYLKTRRQQDPNYHIGRILRSRLNNAIRYYGGKKTGRTLSLIGCSIPELRRHLSKKFKKGMSWKNRGKWHIDHIKPCASFDLTKPSHQRKCFHWTNLQPMWAIPNIQKGAKYDC